MPLKKFRIIFAAVALGFVTAGCWMPGRAQSTPTSRAPLPPRSYTPHKTADIADQRIDESSGLAASRRYPGYLWTHNDSGDKPRLFLLAPDGTTVAVVNVENANAFDWEDMAISGSGEGAWVYVGDIGDNFRWRSNLNIYRFREPQLDVTAKNQNISVRAERMALEYSGRQSNAETLIATPDAHLLIVTKVPGISELWRTPQAFADGMKQTLEKIADYSFGADSKTERDHLATSGDLSPDGRRMAVITYGHLYEWIVSIDENGAPDWKKTWQSTPAVSALPTAKQIEAVAYSTDGEKLFLTSEQRPAPLYELTPEETK